MTHRFQLRFAIVALLATTPGALAQTIYVDANLATGMNDGTSWADALQGPSSLKAALGAVLPGEQIFAAQGTYRPAAGSNRTRVFGLVDGVEVYGGFLGTESSPAQRPPLGSAPSILSGDLAGDDDMGQFGDNSYHLIKSGTVTSSAVLDGFTITGGNANAGGSNNDRGPGILCLNGAAPTIRNCHFIANQCSFGGGAGYINGSAPSFTNCTFEDNDGGSFGGAFDIANAGAARFDRCTFLNNRASRAGALEIFATSGVVVSNSLFVGNVATGSSGGGGLWIGSGGTTEVRGCTIVANQSPTSEVAGLREQSATAIVSNTILWDNIGQGGGQGSANQVSGTADVTYSIVEGGFTGTGNLAGDPLFADAGAGDYRLTSTSPAIDAGDNATAPADAPYDLSPAPRFVDEPGVADSGSGSAPLVDIGAYESSIGVADVYCVPVANSTGVGSIVAATGSTSLAASDVNLVVSDLPLTSFGYFLMSQSTDMLPVASGILCLGTPQFRFSKDVLSSGNTGTMAYALDVTNLPQGQVFSAGETWYFQLWHRDGATSNFTSTLGFTWE